MDNQVRIWLNNWFSQSADIIRLIKERDDRYYVIATNEVFNPAIVAESDEWYQEDKSNKASEESYIEYALKFCKEHKINLLMPLRKMIEISKHREDFERIGVKLVVPSDHYIMDTLNNKVKTYELLKDKVKSCIPAYKVVTNVNEFRLAVDEILDTGKKVCFKYAEDIACRSFRVIDMGSRTIESLSKEEKRTITYEDALKMLGSVKEFKEIIVMEFLEGKEVSCDCLRVDNKNIVIPRIKVNKRIQEVKRHKRLLELCNEILDVTNYDAPCNIQFKLVDGKEPMLLEVNTRMSGGVHIASWASKVNLPGIAIDRYTGKKLEVNNDWKSTEVVRRECYDYLELDDEE